ncbi:hypothetical protein GUJ93_ZPchr0001g30928 [Zizania palustris]|uniref:Uncharacterized protein n=1 Tax=Zizania palustris TaxID=103762 RepID=A0A8J5RLE8_ZIZPA|nr:hypothetical protein GUJ93_ZPchr0001g30928 [Zizania palustris]
MWAPFGPQQKPSSSPDLASQTPQVRHPGTGWPDLSWMAPSSSLDLASCTPQARYPGTGWLDLPWMVRAPRGSGPVHLPRTSYKIHRSVRPKPISVLSFP